MTSGTEYVLKAINGDPNAVVYGARLLIKQSSTATKTIVPYEIGAYFQGTSGLYIDISPLAYYLHKASDWGGTVAIRFEAELRTSSNTTTAYAALATTGNTVVAEVSTT
ncbi:MAG: hypothetical protein QXI60_02555, partial [Thermofilaceae archaeon]